jgi:hypothetical protein
VVVERKTERWIEVIENPLPALLTCDKEIADIPFAPLPDLIRSLRYDPEMWTMETGPVTFDAAQVGGKALLPLSKDGDTRCRRPVRRSTPVRLVWRLLSKRRWIKRVPLAFWPPSSLKMKLRRRRRDYDCTAFLGLYRAGRG